MNSITIVLRSGMGMQIDSVRPYLRNGMPIAIGRAGAVISHFADGDAHLALRTIAEFPCPEQDNLPAANMRQIALAALSGAGASSEPGNPGGEPVSGPGSAGERPYPAPGSGDSELAESLQTLVRWLDRVDIEDGYVGVPVIEAVEVAVNELRRLRQFERICEGLPQDAIDGGWTVQGIRGYAKRLEDQLKAALARVAELERQEPVAWMHDQPNRVDVIHRDVKDLLQRVPGSSRGIHRPLDVSEHYTIPLYAAPVAQAQHSVPDGWKLVPVEPTPEMLDARRDCEDGMDGYLVEDTEYYFPDRGAVRAFLARVYQGLIAAAPAPGGER
ncbi:hypothetical protein [Pseudomonas aeruginosa]|uniref:hypothetical protein n=1 Tax=Pseudomonas aeruginosa TaxID=287 RepID=UPI000772D2D1|nr:hypothetical protein [Pseudomonas aeruginosa]KXC56835.1 hypothetical protein AW894_23400 [Pseudomonas aeruginosa]KXC67162.1 hypothetical protein AW895_23940 [Pseudomonas aeruginosa]KXC69458.1 hypothetical protein AW896_23875 [Pseudomonas aeruginosa]